jgi:hypothetical protein
MARRPSARSVGNALLIALLSGVLVTQALQAVANHMPADKVVAGSEEIMETGTSDTAVPGESITTTPVELLSVDFRSSSPSDLMLQVTLECSIITDVVVPGSTTANSTQTGEAEGRIKAWLEFDGQIVELNTISENPQPANPSSPGNDSDKVTFCNTANKMQITDTENDDDGTDRLRNYLRTKHANAFNWIFFNAGNGIHTVKLFAQFVQGTVSAGSSTTGFVGNRMLIIEPTKFPNDAFTSPTP